MGLSRDCQTENDLIVSNPVDCRFINEYRIFLLSIEVVCLSKE